MVWSLAVRKDISDQRKEEYEQKLSDMELKELVKEFFSYLDYTEESDSGYEFHPIEIGCCRVLMTEPLNILLQKLRTKIKE